VEVELKAADDMVRGEWGGLGVLICLDAATPRQGFFCSTRANIVPAQGPDSGPSERSALASPP